ncbi:kunitz-type serine protease inhibitor homolog alpha-dendrotoxin-like [Rhagoletis pomonella]|uniref:kunitz-type serine protease inhibitor homolog alpha-dendrotoxin-like n=1 Tax=Rhagoletis pomonella TaxID=28610 RepID=UPI0017854E83|nr:kunitz-type serine protease inhibitor homolog alpha-dendrotoxin-like [Rhagoletis pomonella]XP_036341799.1 kunitz-type serine protease inhibitor homolog alpha-dendrotoxin-like [Rhagoletis pomonella]
MSKTTMKFIWIVAFVLLALATLAAAQDVQCPGRPPTQLCLKPKNVGTSGRGCQPRQMWHFNERAQRCERLNYLGCGGNENRFCTLEGCRNSCI